MKIPMPEVLQAAPEGVKLPAREVTRSNVGETARQLGGEIGQAGQQAYGAYEQYAHQARLTQVNDASTAYERAYTDSFHGTTNAAKTDPNAPVADVPSMTPEAFAQFLEGPKPEQTPGYLSTHGEQALLRHDDALADLEKKRQAIAEQMTDGEARKMFLESSDKRRALIEREAANHLGQQLAVARDDSVKNGLAAILRTAALEPMDDELATHLVAEQAGRAAGLASSTEDGDAKVTAIRAEVAKTRAVTLITQEKWDAAEMVVKGSKSALGETGVLLLDKINDGKAGAEVQSIASSIAGGSRSDHIFTPLDLNEVAKKLAAVPEEKRKRVTQAMDELIGSDARRVKAEKDRFVDQATTQFATEPGKFFGSTTANVLREVDPDKYLQLEDRLHQRNKAARAEGRERITLQSNLDKSALDDLKSRLDDAEDPTQVNMQSFLNEHPELSGGKVNEANRLKSAAVKTYEKGLKPSQDTFVAGFVASASNKMPAFTGTPAQQKEQRSQWKAARRNEAIEIYGDAMGEKGEKPEPKVLDEAKARAILDLPMDATPRALNANTKAITNLAAPPPPGPVTTTIKATGQTVTMPDGSVYAVMSDKSTRILQPAKKAKK